MLNSGRRRSTCYMHGMASSHMRCLHQPLLCAAKAASLPALFAAATTPTSQPRGTLDGASRVGPAGLASFNERQPCPAAPPCDQPAGVQITQVLHLNGFVCYSCVQALGCIRVQPRARCMCICLLWCLRCRQRPAADRQFMEQNYKGKKYHEM